MRLNFLTGTNAQSIRECSHMRAWVVGDLILIYSMRRMRPSRWMAWQSFIAKAYPSWRIEWLNLGY